jgi:hypothetical protein
MRVYDGRELFSIETAAIDERRSPPPQESEAEDE